MRVEGLASPTWRRDGRSCGAMTWMETSLAGESPEGGAV